MKKRKGFLLIGVSICVIGLFILLCVRSKQNIQQCTFTNNAAWISSDWVSQPVDEFVLNGFSKRIQEYDFATVYPFVTSMKPDSTFSYSYEYANEFTQAFKAHNNETKLLGWIGLPLANDLENGIQGWVNLGDPKTREAIVDFSIKYLNESGMDGIHIDAETVKNNDEGFLLLLEELDTAIGNKYMISIAGAHWWPNWMVNIPPVKDFRWTSAYYNEVAKHVNQIAVMTYDSHLPLRALYRMWVTMEVRRITNAVEDSEVDLLFGVSVSDEVTQAHQPDVERLKTAMYGMCTAKIDR